MRICQDKAVSDSSTRIETDRFPFAVAAAVSRPARRKPADVISPASHWNPYLRRYRRSSSSTAPGLAAEMRRHGQYAKRIGVQDILLPAIFCAMAGSGATGSGVTCGGCAACLILASSKAFLRLSGTGVKTGQPEGCEEGTIHSALSVPVKPPVMTTIKVFVG
jgi:hypothetical protein